MYPDPTLDYNGMILSVEPVDRTTANEWLKLNTGNRPVRSRVVDQYARDMLSGQWREKPIAICFDQENRLGNGQHTLQAIVKSNTLQLLLIARNVPREAIVAMDMGVKRTVADVAHFLGHEMNKRKAAVARAMVGGIKHTTDMSYQEIYDAYSQHEDAINFTLDNGGGTLPAAIASAIAMAWYKEDRDKLVRFMEILKTGVGGLTPGERTVIVFRDYYNKNHSNTERNRLELHLKTKRALVSFLDDKYVSKIFELKKARFDLE